MAESRYLRRSIDGCEYTYDSLLDVIYSDHFRSGGSLDRTQSHTPVDACVELTTFCNWACTNCFSESRVGSRGAHAEVKSLRAHISFLEPRILRVCITG